MLCCEYHCLALGIEKNETINIENKADKIIWPILGKLIIFYWFFNKIFN